MGDATAGSGHLSYKQFKSKVQLLDPLLHFKQKNIMTNRSKHLPYYVTIIGLLSMSFGFNLIQYEEIKLLRQEKVMYKVFFEYLYLKLETLQNRDFVYNN